MIYLTILMMTSLSFAFHCGLDSTEQIAFNTFGKTKSCISALSSAPTTPEFPSLYFQKVGTKKDFAFRCHNEDKSQMRILFLEDDGLRVLSLPIYYYMSGIDHTDLPRNILHFKDNADDLYIEFVYSDVVSVFTPDKLPAVAKDMMVSMSKVQSEYIKKYETWLKGQGKSEAIKLAAPNDRDLPVLLECLEAKQQDVVEMYIGGKFSSQIPSYYSIVQDLKAFKNLTPEQKVKYQKPWSEIEKEIISDIQKSHIDCQGIVSEASSKKALEKNFAENKELYNRMRGYLSLE